MESTDLGGGRGCFVGATMGWAASVFPLMVAIKIKWKWIGHRKKKKWELGNEEDDELWRGFGWYKMKRWY